MTVEQVTDEQVVTQVLRGDSESFRIIVDRYQQHVYNIGMRFFHREDDAYDFVQEVFLKVFNNLGTYRQKGKFRSWLLKLAYNHGINMIKSSRTEPEFDEFMKPSDAPTPERQHIKGEIEGLLSKEMENLPVKYRVCLDLFFFAGMSFNDISNITDLPVNTIKSHVFRAKRQLRDALRGTMAEEYYEM